MILTIGQQQYTRPYSIWMDQSSLFNALSHLMKFLRTIILFLIPQSTLLKRI